uniref:Uncharacterized protein n=1 Tax=Glossina pallidipes TaxID=7398 RepID=A0A1B0ABC5_GLOPL
MAVAAHNSDCDKWLVTSFPSSPQLCHVLTSSHWNEIIAYACNGIWTKATTNFTFNKNFEQVLSRYQFDLDSIYESWARLAKIPDYLKAVLACPYRFTNVLLREVTNSLPNYGMAKAMGKISFEFHYEEEIHGEYLLILQKLTQKDS